MPNRETADLELQEAVVVSSGFGRLHLALTAREASDRGMLRLAIMGAYPTDHMKRVTRWLGIADKGRIARFLERDAGIPSGKLKPLHAAELLFELTRLVALVPLIRRLHPAAHTWALRLYGWLAGRQLTRSADDVRVFHFLAAYGQSSAERARAMGIVSLCDHAIVHPSVIDELVENRGTMRPRAEGSPWVAAPPKDAHWRAMLADLARADAVLVNSDFVRDTFLAAGWEPNRVYVAYLGVDESFVAGLSPVSRKAEVGRLQLLFAGRVERRKGVDVLLEALAGLDDLDWELTLAGPVAPDVLETHAGLLADWRVKQMGTVVRPRLRELMLATSVFVFPSFAEGSARVIFEALACGCYVITTPNSGSIVEDGIHGALVPPGDADRLAEEIVRAGEDRERVAEIGTRNARLVAKRYRQDHYGDALAAIYRDLAASSQRG